VDYWRGKGSKPTVDAAFKAVITFSENHKFENCSIQHDVIDAMMRQPYTTETLPFKPNNTSNILFAVDYDLGQANYAYWDKVDADYHVSTNKYTVWNNGHKYRNDGVDIEACSDTLTNGYSVGWIEDGEWMQYTIQSEATMAYNLLIRYSGESQTAKIHIDIDGKQVSKSVSLIPTGSWSTWKTVALSNIPVHAGSVKVKVVFEAGGINFNYMQFRNPKQVDKTPSKF